MLIGLDQYSPRCSQTISISIPQNLLEMQCQPHPAPNSEAQHWDPESLLPYFSQDYPDSPDGDETSCL